MAANEPREVLIARLPIPGPGRPPIAQAIKDQVVTRLRQGETQADIVRSGLISWDCLCDTKREDHAFGDAVARAREDSADVWFDKIVDVISEMDTLDVTQFGKAANAEVTRHDKRASWSLEIAKRLNPEKFGDKQRIDLNLGLQELPAHIAQAHSRLLEIRAMPVDQPPEPVDSNTVELEAVDVGMAPSNYLQEK